MTLALKTTPSGYKTSTIRDAITYALSFTTTQSNQRFSYYNQRCREFEQKFNMSSDEFMHRFEAGTIGDDQVYFDWYAAKQGLDIWRERRDILSGVAV